MLAALITLGIQTSEANGQTPSQDPQQKREAPSLSLPEERAPAAVAGESNLYCAGYIRYEPFPKTPQIVGAEQEQERRIFATGDVVYINGGRSQGIREGQQFGIVRPSGSLSGLHQQKKGSLGVYVQELGRLKIIAVNEQTSVGEILSSCEEVLLGDLLAEVPHRTSPIERPDVPIDRFQNPSGKPTGRLMLAKDKRELVTRGDIVFVDLGAEDNLKVGEYLTVYRKVGNGNIVTVHNEEISPGTMHGFQSQQFRGGEFSINATRAKETSEGVFNGRPITTTEIRHRRPPLPRKIVAEIAILNVQNRTATGIVTRVAQEVRTGDFVEIQ